MENENHIISVVLKKNNNEWSIFLSNLLYIWYGHILEKSLEGSLNIVDERDVVCLLFKYMMECQDKGDKLFCSACFHHFVCCNFIREAVDGAIQHLVKEGVITVNKKDEEE